MSVGHYRSMPNQLRANSILSLPCYLDWKGPSSSKDSRTVTSSRDIRCKHITLLVAEMLGELKRCMNMLGCDHPVSYFFLIPPSPPSSPLLPYHLFTSMISIYSFSFSSSHHPHFHYFILPFSSSLPFHFSSMLLPFSISHYLAVSFPFLSLLSFSFLSLFYGSIDSLKTDIYLSIQSSNHSLMHSVIPI